MNLQNSLCVCKFRINIGEWTEIWLFANVAGQICEVTCKVKAEFVVIYKVMKSGFYCQWHSCIDSRLYC